MDILIVACETASNSEVYGKRSDAVLEANGNSMIPFAGRKVSFLYIFQCPVVRMG